ncbi:hypothetical protein HI914_02446, partial [Erysiphe necator]
SQDRFDFKLTIFKEICERVYLSEDKWVKGLPIMLKGDAKKFYYQSIFPHINSLTDFNTIINKIKSNFEGAEYQRTFLETWKDTTLDSLILKFTCHARDLQLGLAPRYRDEEFLYTKLLHACKKNQACELACFKPAPTLEGLITDLRASISLKNNSKSNQYIADNSDSYYTDRRYKSRSSNMKNSHHPKGYDDEQEDDKDKDINEVTIEALTNNLESYQVGEEENTMLHTFFGETDGKDLYHTMTDFSS